MPRKRVRNQQRTKVKVVEFTWRTFIMYSGDNQKEKTIDALKMIMDETGVNCHVNFGSKKKGVYDNASETTYLARFTSKSAFKLELAHGLLLCELIVSTYNKRANETYKNWFTYMRGSKKSGNVSDIGDSECESESESEDEFWEETCEICGTKKGSELPFDVTKCRNMDKSIVANIINKMRGKIEKTYNNFNEGDNKHNKDEFNSMMKMFVSFMEKFIKWCKFSFAYEVNLRYLFRELTRTKYLKNYTYEQVTTINYALQEFVNLIVTTPLPKTI